MAVCTIDNLPIVTGAGLKGVLSMVEGASQAKGPGQLWKSGEQIRRLAKEFDLLSSLMRNQRVPLTHVKLLHGVWGAEHGDERNTSGAITNGQDV